MRPPQEPVFVVGTGTCGTRYLSTLLQENGVEGVYHEKDPALFQHSMRWARGELDEDQEEKFRATLRETREDVAVETNWGHSFIVSLLHDVFPDARFVYIHRDGRECVRSRMSGWDLTPEEGWTVEDTTTPPFLEGEFKAPRFIRLCRWWTTMNRLLLEVLPGTRISWDLTRGHQVGHPRVCVFPFEHLVEPRTDSWNGFQEWLGVGLDTISTDPVGEKTDKPWPAWEDWPEAFQNVYAWICGSTMHDLGYWGD